MRAPILAALFAVLLFAVAAPPASAAPCDPPVTSEVACENSKPGTPENEWGVNGTGDASIRGYTTQVSVDAGETIRFKVKTDASAYRIDIYRLGYYGGDGARRWATILPSAALPQIQPACISEASTGLYDCGTWNVSASWNVPAAAVSGVYVARLVRNDTGGASLIPFVVRDDSGDADIAFQTNDATWAAYNPYGGNSLYQCTNDACPPGEPLAYKAAYKVSYNRPFTTAGFEGPVLFHNEYSMIRFMEANGYDMSYLANVDTHRRGHLLLNHKVFMTSGHDEYWSKTQRDNIKAARNAGVHLAFFSGNLAYWKTRWEPSIDGAGTQDRTLVSYKDTHFDAAVDPVEWTGTWRDNRFSTQEPENSLTGLIFKVNFSSTPITVPSTFRDLRLWRNTSVALLENGESEMLADDILGYEFDEDIDNGFRPAGQFHLSSTHVTNVQVFTDYGSTLENGGSAHHNITMYRATSGALVFNAGTVQWSWGLDTYSVPGNPPPNRTQQQMMLNLFADMESQPATPLPGLVVSGPSTDGAPPTSQIGSLPAAVADGDTVTVTGTATDAGGGVVAGVEVSTDGGATWHPATGTSTWSYSWKAHGSTSKTIKSRAVDDSGNLETPGAGVSVDVSCPCSIFADADTPSVVDTGDPNGAELGVKFRADRHGVITGIRFYKAAGNTGTHTGSLWSASGERLAQATFTGESASGWQTVTFSQPVPVLPDTTYVASYYAPNGHYSTTRMQLFPLPAPGPSGAGALFDSTPLTVVRSTGGTANGVYSYSPSSTFPTSGFQGSNYFVDVLFEATPITPPGAVANVSAAVAGRTSVSVTWDAPADGGPPSSYRVTPYVGASAQTPRIVTGSPPATSTTVTGLTEGTTYTFRVRALNSEGAGPESGPSNAVTPAVTPPSAPTGVMARPATRSAQLSWTESTGDSPISSYTVTPFQGSTALTPVQVGGGTTTTTIDGLDNGTAYTFRVRATNADGDSAQSAPSSAVTARATIFDFQTPAIADSGDPTPIELGVKFRADTVGTITGIRFYKASANTGTHSGSLWSGGGERLAQATFTGESATGWQSVLFDSPVAIAPGTTYVASYHAPNGHYSGTSGGLAQAVSNGPLQALANTATPNGVYSYSPTTTFPTNSFQAANYFVDVLFAATPPGAVTNVAAEVAGRTSVSVTWDAPTGGGPPSSYRVTPYVGSSAQTPKVVSGSPPPASTTVTGLTEGTTYTFRVQALNGAGAGPESGPSNAVTPAVSPPTAPTGVIARPATRSVQLSWNESSGDSPISSYTVTPFVGGAAQTPVQVGGSTTSTTIDGLDNGTAYTFRVKAANADGDSAQSAPSSQVTPRATIFDFQTPAVADSGDPTSVELGVKFRADAAGSITGIRFYKAVGNTGTHTGSLWSVGGERLAQATFTGESAGGWQSVLFDTPVPVTPGTTYVASYHAPQGHYSGTSGGLAQAVTNGPLQALANSATPNGVYSYSPVSSFPINSYQAANYFVDVLFAATPPGAATNAAAEVAGRTSVSVTWDAPAAGGLPSSYRVTPYVGSSALPSRIVSGSPPATSTTVTGLTEGTTYTFRVQALNDAGAGPESGPSNSVTPGVSAPSAPSGVVARPATRSAQVSWNESTGDGAISSYTVTPFVGSAAQPPVQVGGSTTTTTIDGLDNGTAYTFRVKATNADGDSPQSAPSNQVTPRATIFDFQTPAVADSGDPSSVELGVKFRTDTAGTITGIRFYKASANTGTHSGSLWSAGGERLAQGTFTGESAGGWQSMVFGTPVPVTPGTTYVASYHAPNGHYSGTAGGLAQAVSNGPLQALANTATTNGVYSYSPTSTFPTASFQAGNYFVDVLFAATPPGAVTNVAAEVAGRTSASVTWDAPTTGGPPSGYRITPYVGSSAQTPKTVSGSPPATSTTVTGLTEGTTYTFRVQALNDAGAGPESGPSNAVTPAASPPSAPTGVIARPATRSVQLSWTESTGDSPISSYTVTPFVAGAAQTPVQVSGSTTTTTIDGLDNGTAYTFRVKATNADGDSPQSAPSSAVTPRATIFDFQTPAIADSGDHTPVELGVKFRTDTAGTITGIRFYKASANTGTHTGSLWTTDGSRLAQATFTSESPSGWQTATLDTPVPVTATTTYVASYYAPNGRYSSTSAAFGAPITSPPLEAIANGASPNGVYVYSDASAFPTASHNATNYFVDVLFAPSP